MAASRTFRNIPRRSPGDLMKRAKIAAAVEGKSIKALVIEVLGEKIRNRGKGPSAEGEGAGCVRIHVNGMDFGKTDGDRVLLLSPIRR